MVNFKNLEDIVAIRSKLLDWFAIYQRPLPWRNTYTPYHVWISEIMGQQTQMERVAQYFLRWMERFPDLAAVAAPLSTPNVVRSPIRTASTVPKPPGVTGIMIPS